MLKALFGVRLVSLGALVLAVVMIGRCSSTGVSNARGIGAELIRRDPSSYLVTIALLAGPLLLLLALPLVLTIGRIDRRKAGLILAAVAAAGAGAVVTAYIAFALSIAGLCTAGSPTPAQDASCAAGTGGLAGFFGVAILAALPFAIALRRQARVGGGGGS